MLSLALLLLAAGCGRADAPTAGDVVCALDESLVDVPPDGDHYRLLLRGVIGVTDALAVEGDASAVLDGQHIDLFGRAASDTVKEVLRQLPVGASWNEDWTILTVETVGTGVVLDDLRTIRIHRASTTVPREVLDSLRDGNGPRVPLSATTFHAVDLDLVTLEEVRSQILARSVDGGAISVLATRGSQWEDGDPVDLALMASLTPTPEQVAAIETAESAPSASSCDSIPPRACPGTDAWCAEVVLFDPPTGLGYDDVPLNGETRANPGRSHLRRDVAQLIRNVAARVQCETREWSGGNGAPLVLGDMSAAGGATPGPVNGRAIHPAGTHTDGKEVDVGYYQTAFFPNNFMRAVCPHHDERRDVRHCTGPPTSLDARRTAYFVSLLSEDPRVKCVGVDAAVVGPVGEAQLALLREGVITLEQFSATTLCHEAADGGRGWYHSHHTHMHVATR